MANLKVVAISDVHCKWNKLKIPECDILISVGDYSFQGEKHVVRDYHHWLNEQDAGYIISIQGNHEKWVEKNFAEAKQIAEEECPGVHFMVEGLVEIEGIKIWGSAITPWFHNWAYNRYRGEDILRHWSQIPEGIDILATHGPVYGILDEVLSPCGDPYDPPRNVGCEMLLQEIKRVKPAIHLCGHIHSGYGQVHKDSTSYYNVSVCDEMYVASNPVTIIEYDKDLG